MSNLSSTSTDEYRSTQMKCFMLAVERTLEKICEGVTIEEFRQIVQKHELTWLNQKKINKMHSLLKQKIVESSFAELKEVVTEDELDEKFIALNELIAGNNSSNSDQQMEPVWRPPGDVTEHIRSHLVKVRLEQKASLELYVQEQEELVKNLMNAVKTLRDKANETLNDIVDFNNRVVKANGEWTEMLELMRKD